MDSSYMWKKETVKKSRKIDIKMKCMQNKYYIWDDGIQVSITIYII